MIATAVSDIAELEVEPILQHPRFVAQGTPFLLTVDLRPQQFDETWPYPDLEEVPIHCIINSGSLFSVEFMGEPVSIAHRYGGTYSPARFLLTPVEGGLGKKGKVRITLANRFGVPMTTLETDEIEVRESVSADDLIRFAKGLPKWDFKPWKPKRQIDRVFLENLPLIAAIFAYYGIKHPEDGHIADELRIEIDKDFERDSALAYLPSNIVESCQNSPIAQNFNLSFAKNRTWNQVDRELKLKRLVLIWRQGEIAAPICIVQRNENSYLVCDENGNLSDKSFEKEIEEFYGNEGLSALFVQKLEAFSVPVVRVGWYDPELFTFPVVTYTKNGERVERTGSARLLRERLGNTELEMVEISGGKFRMGSPEGEGHDDEHPPHEVTVPSFSIGKYPVTQAQYEAVMGKNPSRFKENGANRPVEKVSWNNAKEFCRKLSELTGKNYRLPSEAEWEYACRAGTQTKYYFGDSESNLDEFAWYGSNSERRTHEVGEKLANAFGLYDMHGNVWEWCEDNWHDNYKKAPTDGSAWVDKKSERYVSRGGSWSNYANSCRSAYRFINLADFDYYNGFRVVSTSR